MEVQEVVFYNFICIWFVERENAQFRVLIPFLSSLFKVFFWFTILVRCQWHAYDDNDMVKCLITLLQKWDVTSGHIIINSAHLRLQEKTRRWGKRVKTCITTWKCFCAYMVLISKKFEIYVASFSCSFPSRICYLCCFML